MRVLIASDKFKGSLTATEVIAHIAAGISQWDRAVEVASVIVADGGDGMLAAAQAAGFTLMPVTVAGPTGAPVESAYAVRSRPLPALGRDVVVEMADACGLLRLPDGIPAPLTASSRGLGEVMRVALERERPTRMWVGIGGSALTQVEFACDVDSPLTGPSGAAAVFAPQKGADPAQVEALDAGLTHWADVVTGVSGQDLRAEPGAGAAGGVGYAARAVLGAHLRPGIDIVLDLVGLEAALAGCDLVITGEGSIDAQTVLGKAPAGVARRAAAHGIPVVVVCGRRRLTDAQLAASDFAGVYALTDLEPDPAICMARAGELLERLVTERVLPGWAPVSGPPPQ